MNWGQGVCRKEWISLSTKINTARNSVLSSYYCNITRNNASVTLAVFCLGLHDFLDYVPFCSVMSPFSHSTWAHFFISSLLFNKESERQYLRTILPRKWVRAQLTKPRNLCCGETRPAGLRSSSCCCSMLKVCQTLQTERGCIRTRFSLLTPEKCWPTLINGQDLRVEILVVFFLHHVLIYRQPCRAHAQLSGPWEAQPLQGRHFKNSGSVTFKASSDQQKLQGCYTFWMLSSTRPPRTYTLSASTVFRAEIQIKWRENSLTLMSTLRYYYTLSFNF